MQPDQAKEHVTAFKFEAGMTHDEIQKYIATLRVQMKGKIPDAQLEALIAKMTQSTNNLQTVCDSCENEITEVDKCRRIITLCEDL